MFLAKYKKKRAIRSYILRLGKDLSRRYGKSKTYTAGQVEKTVHDEGYNWRHICYAHALYTSMKQFNKWHDERGESCDYNEMREEVSDTFFGGDISYIESGSFCDDSAGGSGGDGGGSD
ncbi:DUF6559 family protein [Pseudoalteromonas luteoviolacea]|uniref:Uncharacterized protein n=1 Tax=Pseudoalteromonas luteoviolacea (strain 2ta16) TaxID=1353533 RepID=V4J8C3_PSEL2|nr:DUF6559 family protein [Pseudoalteromonas luteoviolacea]ESP91492.1 hypothetical protein PL2TA16_00291 [Pseudoalteromonas luteoviolacea 2ta16]KZN40143.1 hypothetical protein N483_18310 [Pseudoalteromonas luteoviolacea NCIMB 1944]